jgi:hypothetical protein
MTGTAKTKVLLSAILLTALTACSSLTGPARTPESLTAEPEEVETEEVETDYTGDVYEDMINHLVGYEPSLGQNSDVMLVTGVVAICSDLEQGATVDDLIWGGVDSGLTFNQSAVMVSGVHFLCPEYGDLLREWSEDYFGPYPD